jgi:hypothetical protein
VSSFPEPPSATQPKSTALKLPSAATSLYASAGDNAAAAAAAVISSFLITRGYVERRAAVRLTCDHLVTYHRWQ